MSTKRISYGPGSTSGGKRPPYADSTQNKYGKYDAHFITQDAGGIYLTFDCGYEYFAKDENGKTYPVTSRILDTLKEKNVKAVFFITLPYAQKNPALVQRMIDEGHAVGNHSSTHPDMTTISIDQMVTEILTLHNYVLDNFHYKMHLFRPPTGAFSEQSLAVTQSLGYKTVDWSFAYRDWDPDQQPALDAAK
jgi:peptidoglycan-N-acetylmuramic acid deacetylase